MPFISRRSLAELHARTDRLRERAETVEHDLLVQACANGRLAGRTAKAEDAIATASAVLTASRRELREENARLRQLIERQRTTIRGLNSQLDHALGYTPEEIALLDAGTTRKELTSR